MINFTAVYLMYFMKNCIYLAVFVSLIGCTVKKHESPSALAGTWKLLSGTLIEKGDTTFTDYTTSVEMIKVINQTHFAFLNHDMNHGKDSTANFVAGGGRYRLEGESYTEHLEYCSDRQWEGHDFEFEVEISNDTLTQRGTEVIAELGVNRLNIEKYVRVK